MCGIFGYTGTKPASPILLDGLRTLEYRGYDSAGLYVGGAGRYRAVGLVDALAQTVPGVLSGTAGIAHTRWATHGPPTVSNAHPHHDQGERVWLVHNGIIENFEELRHECEANGCTFYSDTDTEVLAQLVGIELAKGLDLSHAVASALKLVRGTYGIAVMATSVPDEIVVARHGSPIAVGVKEGEYFVSSDAAPILRHTKEIIYLEDGDIAILNSKGYEVCTHDHRPLSRTTETITWDVDDIKRGGYAHFMLKEICEAASVLENSARGRIDLTEGNVRLGGLADHAERLREIDRIIIVGCGSAYLAGVVGKHMIEEYAHVPVEVELASELRYRNFISSPKSAVFAISQSGETADTLAAVREARQQGLLTFGIVNVVGSTIARETDAGVYNHAGPEIGVASTKAFLSQLEVLLLIAVYIGRMRGLSKSRASELLADMVQLPTLVTSILERKEEVQLLAERYLGYDDFLFIGRKYNYATAFEGALKLKEVAYVHAEGYGAGEMKHGPIAMLDEWFPVFAIVPKDSVYEKMYSNIQEVKARKGRVLAIATEGDARIKSVADDVFYIPAVRECLTPILANIPLQLFAYYQGVLRGLTVDRPRNLAKSVTVE